MVWFCLCNILEKQIGWKCWRYREWGGNNYKVRAKEISCVDGIVLNPDCGGG